MWPKVWLVCYVKQLKAIIVAFTRPDKMSMSYSDVVEVQKPLNCLYWWIRMGIHAYVDHSADPSIRLYRSICHWLSHTDHHSNSCRRKHIRGHTDRLDRLQDKQTIQTDPSNNKHQATVLRTWEQMLNNSTIITLWLEFSCLEPLCILP